MARIRFLRCGKLKTIFHIRNCKSLRARFSPPLRQLSFSFYFYVLDSVYWHNLIPFINAISLRGISLCISFPSPSLSLSPFIQSECSLEAKDAEKRRFVLRLHRQTSLGIFQFSQTARLIANHFLCASSLISDHVEGGRTATVQGIDFFIALKSFYGLC